jgi:pyruvate, orthophosphate dikinase
MKAWGRLFSRNPRSGVKRLSAEIHLAEAPDTVLPFFSLQKSFPEVAQQLQDQVADLEQTYRDAVQVDFELPEQELRIVAHEPLLRGPQAAIKIAVSLVGEGLISQSEALLKVSPEFIRQILLPHFEATSVRRVLRQESLLTLGEGVQGGVISGRVALNSDSAFRFHQQGEPVILICEQLTYLEREALPIVGGLVVKRGPTLVAQQFERPCVVAADLKLENSQAIFQDQRVTEGEVVSLDANTGQIFLGPLQLIPGELTPDAVTLLTWADQVREIEIRANIGSVQGAKLALTFGAEGVGLCRIESLFQSPERLPRFQTAFREICLDLPSSSALEQLAQDIEDDVYGLLIAVAAPDRTPFAMRLLDAPVSQMIRHWKEQTELPAGYFEGPLESWLHELNPLQGLRCGRLSLLFPRLMKLQVEAILKAWNRVTESGTSIRLQIMMPGVCDVQEIRILRQRVQEVANEIGVEMPEVGSMLELPRACLTADVLSEAADFFSFGTGDLTESTCGISRYDAQLSFLSPYLEKGILGQDPFRSIDQHGVGALMKTAVERVHAKCPTLELGTCGAQVVDPESLAFCCRLGLKYVSVPAHHVPVARLAAAQVELRR